MQQPDEIRDSRTQNNGDTPLPLFRPEAILNQQQKSYGDIILIRPLSLTLLTGLALAIVALAAAFLLLGHYTEKARVSGALLAEPGGTTTSSTGLRAELYVPGRLLASVEPGARLQLYCGSCPQKLREQNVTVLKVSDTPITPDSSSANTKASEPSYKVTVSLPPGAAQSDAFNHPPQTGVPVEAEIPLDRKPLLKWLFKPSGS